MSSDNGHSQDDVLYVAFPNITADASDPLQKGAKRHAKSFVDFEVSISGVGDSLIQRLSYAV